MVQLPQVCREHVQISPSTLQCKYMLYLLSIKFISCRKWELQQEGGRLGMVLVEKIMKTRRLIRLKITGVEGRAGRDEGDISALYFKVRTAWLWLRSKVIELMSDQGPTPALSNTELLMLMYPRCRKEAEVIFLLSTYTELVDREVVGKQKDLMLGTLRGVLKAKAEQLGSRAVPEINFPPDWL